MSSTKMKLWIAGYLVLAAAATIRVPVLQRDRMQIAADLGIIAAPSAVEADDLDNLTTIGKEWDRAWLWELGPQVDGSDVRLLWLPFLITQGALLVLAIIFKDALVWMVSRVAPAEESPLGSRAGSSVDTAEAAPLSLGSNGDSSVEPETSARNPARLDPKDAILSEEPMMVSERLYPTLSPEEKEAVLTEFVRLMTDHRTAPPLKTMDSKDSSARVH